MDTPRLPEWRETTRSRRPAPCPVLDPQAPRPLFLGHLTEPDNLEQRHGPYLRPPGHDH